MIANSHEAMPTTKYKLEIHLATLNDALRSTRNACLETRVKWPACLQEYILDALLALTLTLQHPIMARSPAPFFSAKVVTSRTLLTNPPVAYDHQTVCIRRSLAANDPLQLHAEVSPPL